MKGYRNTQSYEGGGYEDYSGRPGGLGSYDYAEERYHGGGHNKKQRMVPSEPSPHVIFLGLDPDFTEADVSMHPLIP